MTLVASQSGFVIFVYFVVTIEQMERDEPSARVLAIVALEKLNAREALPRLRELLRDTRRSNFGDRTPVAEAAKHALAVISQLP